MTTINPGDRSIMPGGAVDQQMVVSWTSPWILLTSFQSFFIQGAWTGSPTGTFILQVSGDSGANAAVTPTVTDTLAGSSAGATGENVQSWAYNLGSVPFNWVRVSYTNNSDAGLLTSLNFNGK